MGVNSAKGYRNDRQIDQAQTRNEITDMQHHTEPVHIHCRKDQMGGKQTSVAKCSQAIQGRPSPEKEVSLGEQLITIATEKEHKL